MCIYVFAWQLQRHGVGGVRARSQVDISYIFGDDGGGGLLCQPFRVYPAF